MSFQLPNALVIGIGAKIMKGSKLISMKCGLIVIIVLTKQGINGVFNQSCI